MLSKLKYFLYHHLHFKWFIFQYLNRKFHLNLNYRLNKNGVEILQEIFQKQIYKLPNLQNEEPVILDIGAHYGFFTIYASRHYGESCRIIAVEPSSKNIIVLRQNLKKAGVKNAEIVQSALAMDNEKRTLLLSRDQNNSLLRTYLPHATKSEIVESMNIEMLLNKFQLSYIDLMKMDCEGGEHEIFMHTQPHIFDKIRFIYVEMHFISDQIYNTEHSMNKLLDIGFQICKTNSINLVNYLQYINFVVLLERLPKNTIDYAQ